MRLRVWWVPAVGALVAVAALGLSAPPAGAGRWSAEGPRDHRAGCIEVAAEGVIPPGGSRLVRIPLRLRAGVCPPGGRIVTSTGSETGLLRPDSAG